MSEDRSSFTTGRGQGNAGKLAPDTTRATTMPRLTHITEQSSHSDRGGAYNDPSDYIRSRQRIDDDDDMDDDEEAETEEDTDEYAGHYDGLTPAQARREREEEDEDLSADAAAYFNRSRGTWLRGSSAHVDPRNVAAGRDAQDAEHRAIAGEEEDGEGQEMEDEGQQEAEQESDDIESEG